VPGTAHHDARIPFLPFDWGHATLLPALPRVQVGRIILCPARYRATQLLHAAREAESLSLFADTVAEWRSRWRVPRYVYVGFFDYRVLVDLDSTFHLNGLRLELRRSPKPAVRPNRTIARTVTRTALLAA